MKTYFKKLVGATRERIGVLTVVAPELVLKKHFDATTEYADTVMKVTSKKFYNFLGHWLVPDIGLKNTDISDPYFPNTYPPNGEPIPGRGLGIGPFSYDEEARTYNDLTKALDFSIYSSPAPIVREINDKAIETFTASGGIKSDEMHPDTISTNYETSYKEQQGKQIKYEWKGKWGDSTAKYQKSAKFKMHIIASCERVPGNWAGKKYETGYKYLFWAGDTNDYNNSGNGGTFYETPQSWDVPGDDYFGKQLKRFYNPYYSSGYHAVNNDGQVNAEHEFTIHREPYSTGVMFCIAEYARGGHTSIGLLALVNSIKHLVQPLIDVLNALGNALSAVGLPTANIGDKVWGIITEPFRILDELLSKLIGVGYSSKSNWNLSVTDVTEAKVAPDPAKSHPAYWRFENSSFVNQNMIPYLYTQYEYPNIDRNACYPYTGNFQYRKPFLENKVVASDFHFDSPYVEMKLGRKYPYFVPNLWRLTFETNIGVFYEQLAKQHKNNNILRSDDMSLQVKLNQKDVLAPATVKRHYHEKEDNLDDLIFPTNKDDWNTYIENGWPDDAKSTNLSFLQNFIPSATESATEKTFPLPTPYASAADGTYQGTNVNTISEINDVIGNFADLKAKLSADDGYELNTWSKYCADPSEFKTLSSGTPKNLSYKIIEYMLWYLDSEGIAFQTRNSVKNLIAYEEYLDQIIDEQKNTPGGNLDPYHVVGTEKYERQCK